MLKCHAQDYKYKNYTTIAGLPSSEVYHAIQDSKGYIWFATDNGVSRFDGYKFVNYDNLSGLLNNTVFDLYEDLKGRIWFIAFSGRLCYFEHGKIVQYKYNHLITEAISRTPIPEKQAFFVDSLDNIYLSIKNNGILKITMDGKISNLLDQKDTSAIVVKNFKKQMMVGYNLESSQSNQLQYKNKNFPFAIDGKIRCSSPVLIEMGTNKELLVCIRRTIYQLKTGRLEKLKHFNNDILWFKKDKNGRFWLSLRNIGVFCYKSFDFEGEDYSFFLAGKDVSSVLIDNENAFWFTTLSNGVFYLPSNKIKSLHVPGYPNANVLSVGVCPNSICLGFKHKKFVCYDKSFTKKKLEVQFKDNNVATKSVFSTKWNELVIGTYKMFSLYNEKSFRELKDFKGTDIAKMDMEVSVKSICAGKGDYFWAGTHSGLYKFNKDSLLYASNIDDSWRKTVYAIHERTNGTLCLGTLDGLYFFENGKFEHFADKNQVFANRINALHESNNQLFIGTKGFGLLVLDFKDYGVRILTTEDGLNSNTITSICSYKNDIWIGTNKGVNQIKLENKRIKSIGSLDRGTGLAGDEINQLAIEDSTLYIATRTGLSYFSLNEFDWEQEKPKVYLESIKINGVDTLLSGKYRLRHLQKNITFSYVGISFKSNKNILYKYRLHPLDKNWKETSKTEINYTGLPPGDYNFVIKAKGQSGLWSDNFKGINFSIAKPYWYTWWFYLIIVIILASLIALLVQYRNQRVNKKNLLRRNLNEYMHKAVAAMINDHFLFNSLNSLNNLIIKDNKIESSRMLAKISNYLRALLFAVQRHFISFSDELRFVNLYLEIEKHRLKEKLDYVIIIDKSLNINELYIPGMFIQPFLEMAIWTGFVPSKIKKKVSLSITREGRFLRISIKKNHYITDNNSTRFENYKYEAKQIEKRQKLLNDYYHWNIQVAYSQLDLDGSELEEREVEILLEYEKMDKANFENELLTKKNKLPLNL